LLEPEHSHQAPGYFGLFARLGDTHNLTQLRMSQDAVAPIRGIGFRRDRYSGPHGQVLGDLFSAPFQKL
jgi:hypothetical protein